MTNHIQDDYRLDLSAATRTASPASLIQQRQQFKGLPTSDKRTDGHNPAIRQNVEIRLRMTGFQRSVTRRAARLSHRPLIGFQFEFLQAFS